MVKEQFRETDVARQISHLTFGFMSSSQMQQSAHVQLVNEHLYSQDPAHIHTPVTHGPLDHKMGLTQKNQDMCQTCEQHYMECVGHFGYIDLALPCFHTGFMKATLQALQIICKTCSAILLQDDAKKQFEVDLKRANLDYIDKKALRKKIHVACEKVSLCPKCGDFNGKVKKLNGLKIVHEKYRKRRGEEPVEALTQDLQPACKENKILTSLIPRVQDMLDPIKVLNLFKQMKTEDIPFLLMDSNINKPQDLILTRILAAPNCVRPSVFQDTRSNEDDITIRLGEILMLNNFAHKYSTSMGAKFSQLREIWDYLQMQVSLLFNSEMSMSGIPRDMQVNRSLRGFVQRLKGKQGRFRGHLSGKRVDYTGRTVISPDPNMRIDQVGIPVDVAKLITFPEVVSSINIHFLRKFVRRGKDKFPGALSVQQGPFTRKLMDINAEKIAENLKIGDIVFRHMMDNDIILFNRQPSLHKLSIQAFYVKVMPHKTFRFNECCCNPFNADFDGDEMNIHLPQTYEAKAEALVLMGSKSNMITPRNGEPLIAAIQDFITGAYLLTLKDVFLDRSHAMRIVSSILTGQDTKVNVTMPKPAIMKPCQMWTGKQLFSLILRPNQSHPVKVNMRSQNKSYRKAKDVKQSGDWNQNDLCPCDGYVVIYNSELMCGVMDKSTLGGGSKDNVFYNILCYFGEQHAADSLARLAKICPAFLTNRGFSIGLGDVTPGARLLEKKKQLLEDGDAECRSLIKAFDSGALVPDAGFSREETLEAKMLKELSGIREAAGQTCLSELHKTNSPQIMAVCGSKGSTINISQMIACVGQQVVSGKRVPNGFEGRALPHFPRGEKSAGAGGFVQNSFYSGLTPTEFFFHTVAGREGLVDTAVKTANTGYMQRRLVKNLEDLCVQYDNTVRTCSKEIVQFVFGGDSLNPAIMEATQRATKHNARPEDPEHPLGSLRSTEKAEKSFKDISKPINFDRLWEHNQAAYARETQGERTLSGEEMLVLADTVLHNDPQWRLNKPGFYSFKCDILEYVREKAKKLGVTWSHFPGLDPANPRHKGILQVQRMTETQLRHFLDACLGKYKKALIEPGEAVGAITAQSVGEPGTQMTLKTFHFAGVASMNITQGVPRLNEIINASKSIKTPIIVAELERDDDETEARIVKSRLDCTTLGEVTDYFQEVYLPDDNFILVKLNWERIAQMKLEVSMDSIRQSLVEAKLKIAYGDLSVYDDTIITINVDEVKDMHMFYRMQKLKRDLENVVIKGIPNVAHAVIHKEEVNSKTTYKVMVEGTNLRGVMATRGVKGSHTDSNDIVEVSRTLGIEAARATIMHEIIRVMSEHGMSIDIRHTMMLSDLMTYRGEVHGITREGLAKIKQSALMLASFEKTADHLFDAAYYGQRDNISGVSECIIMGTPMSLGTGLFKLLHSAARPPSKMHRPLLFDTPAFHHT